MASASPSNNYAPANLGQLKYVATQAKRYLDIQLHLAGGAGSDINDVVNNLEPKVGVAYTAAQLSAIRASNYSPANIGQLKAIAKVFYDRLNDKHYSTNANLKARGYHSSWAHRYPWNPSDPWNQPGTADKSINYAPVNLGQLKLVFSFDLQAHDAGEPPDWWKMMYFGNTSVNGTTDSDGDGESDYLEFVSGTRPIPGGPPGDEDEDGVPDSGEGQNGTSAGNKDNPALKLSVFGYSAP